jgi:hypothetical protein
VAGVEVRTPPEADHELVGSGVSAALSSFAFFASGALVPVLPFLLGLTGTAALVWRPCSSAPRSWSPARSWGCCRVHRPCAGRCGSWRSVRPRHGDVRPRVGVRRDPG